MACTIVLQDVRGVVPVGQTEITTLRVVGDAPGCASVEISSTSLGIALTVVTVSGNQFFAELPITASPKPDCGDLYDLRVECTDHLCQQQGTFQLRCCEIDIFTVAGITPGHVLRPTTLEIYGEAAGCPIASGAASASVQVSASTTTGAVIGTTTASVDNQTRRFLASVPISQTTTRVVCGETITITASCDAGTTCAITETFEVRCLDCYRVEATVDLSQPCTGPAGAQTKPVSINVDIGLPAGVTSRSFVWDLGGGTLGPQFTATVVSDSDIYRHKETFNLAPGTYTATLRFVGGAPENCLEYTKTFTVSCTTASACPSVDPPMIGPCKPNGTRTVTFVSHPATTGGAAFCEWEFIPAGPGGVPAAVTGSGFVLTPGGASHTDTFDYPAPAAGQTTFPATLKVLSTTGCDQQVSVDVPACPPATPCPSVTASAACLPNGKCRVMFVATPAATGGAASCEWEFIPAGPGNVPPAVTGSVFSLTPGGANHTESFDYPASPTVPTTVTATLRVVGSPMCDQQVTVNIPACPVTTSCDLDISDPLTYTVGTCDANGQRLVTVTATLNNTDPAADRYFWQWDPAIPATTGLTAVQGNPGTHLFDAPGTGMTTRQVTLTVVRGPDCVASASVPVDVPGCGTACPQVTLKPIDTANAVCASDGNHRIIVLDATVTGSGVSQFIWTFGDGTMITRPANVGPQVTHDYAPGTYTVTLETKGPGTCSDTKTVQITVPACCPVVTGISAGQIPCQKGTATVSTNLSASFTGAGSSFDWNFGDGSPTVTTPTPNAPPHDYPPGSYMVSVTAHAPNCPDSTLSQSITISPCSDPTRTEIDLCTGLLWTAIIFSIIGFVLLIVGCILGMNGLPYVGAIVQWIGAGFAATAIILFVIWWILCRFITPCRVINTVYNVVLVLNVIAAVIAIILGILAVKVNIGYGVCALWAIITWGQWALVAKLLHDLAQARGCQFEVNEDIPPPPSSSSNPLTGDPQRLERPHAYPSAADSPVPYGPNEAMRRAIADEPEPEIAADSPSATSVAVVESERATGLGDVLKRATSAIGIEPCAGCHERAERLNRAFPFHPSEGSATPPPEQPA